MLDVISLSLHAITIVGLIATALYKKHSCNHTWHVVSKTYTAPNQKLTSASNLSDYLTLRLVYGLTIVELKCDKCGKIYHESTHGKAE